MDFVTKHFGKMNLWPVEHFYNIFVLTFGLLYSAITPKSEDKYVVKVFNSTELDFSEVYFIQNWYFRRIYFYFLWLQLTEK